MLCPLVPLSTFSLLRAPLISALISVTLVPHLPLQPFSVLLSQSACSLQSVQELIMKLAHCGIAQSLYGLIYHKMGQAVKSVALGEGSNFILKL